MLEAIGPLLPAAVGVALSPVPIVAFVLAVSGARATAKGVGFSVGWVMGMALLTTVVILVADGSAGSSDDSSPILAWLRVVVGLALLALAARTWRNRPGPEEDPEGPGWMSSLEGIAPPRALLTGVVLAAANPKNVAFTFAGASAVAEAGLESVDSVLLGGLFVLLASSSVLVLLAVRVVGGSRSDAALGAVRTFMATNTSVITMVLLVVLGAMVLGDGLSGI